LGKQARKNNYMDKEKFRRDISDVFIKEYAAKPEWKDAQ
jgi:hypothetical protein